MTSEWKRTEHGWLRRDGAWFLERGARMSTGGTNAWMILRRVGADRIGRDATTCYDEKTGSVLWGVNPETGWSAPVEATDLDTPLYAHDLDAGSLAEAKYAVRTVEAQEATLAEARARIAGTDAVSSVIAALREADARRAAR